MMKKTMIAILSFVAGCGVSMAETAHVQLQVGNNHVVVALSSGMTAPIAMTEHQGDSWKGFQGTIKDVGKAVAYRIQIRNSFTGNPEWVHGLLPLRKGVATITVRPGLIPAVKD
jgi:hypothetical protein